MTLRMLLGREPKHGTITGYFNDGCRCEDCRTAGLAYAKAYRERKKAERG